MNGGSVKGASDAKGAMKVWLAPAMPSENSLSMDLYHEDVRTHLAEVAPELCVKTIEPAWGRSQAWIFEQLARYVTYPFACRMKSLGAARGTVFHVLDHSSGHLCRSCSPSVVTCHDLADWRTSAMSGTQLRLWKYRVRGLRKARRIVAISRNTAADIAEILGISAAKIDINPYGISPDFRPLRTPGEPRQTPELAREDRSTLLLFHVGTNIPRKNIPTLLRALRAVNDSGQFAKLVKVGPDPRAEFAAMTAELALNDHIIHLGGRTQQQLIAIYNDCDILCFPSAYEGFGRPVLEAQACGLPSVLANSSSLPEVGGDGALFHETFDDAGLTRRILELAHSPGLTATMREKGFANARRFTWQRHAARLAEVYGEVLLSEKRMPQS